ncbi:transglutaminase-like cysteine peptidase [Rhizobium leguminosarum]|nr:transglutaminase-like cysteine peptidase [Rhizobium leguminosarum]
MPTSRFIVEKRRTAAPFAHVVFCARNAQDCSITGQGWEVVLSPLIEKQLRDVNRSVNRSIRAQSDGQNDVWQTDVASGDCEDYALTKRARLIAKGQPSAALRIAVTKTPDHVGHAVLVVRTNRGDLVLDNRSDRIIWWNDTDLHWLMIQSAEDPRVWYAL